MALYRKKPVVIEAFKWTGDQDQTEDPEWIVDKMKSGDVWLMESIKDMSIKLIIRTLEGNMEASRGDYIIKGIQGELYPCKPDIFEQTYESVES